MSHSINTLLSLGVLALLISGSAGPMRAQTAPLDATIAGNPGKSLVPGDKVKLEIWREPDLSGEFEVDEQGVVVLPKLGPIQVKGRTAEALKASLISRYATYLRNPAIGITVLHRVSVLGAVRNPGIYTVAPTMTLADVVALAGGASSEGKSDRFELLRGGTRMLVLRGKVTRVDATPIQSGDQVLVPLKGWASRNPGVVAGTITAVAGIVVTLLVK